MVKDFFVQFDLIYKLTLCTHSITEVHYRIRFQPVRGARHSALCIPPLPGFIKARVSRSRQPFTILLRSFNFREQCQTRESDRLSCIEERQAGRRAFQSLSLPIAPPSLSGDFQRKGRNSVLSSRAYIRMTEVRVGRMNAGQLCESRER